ncbi:MAG: dihydroorotate dehydrogenase [Spirochaetaceae bacterium]|nr:dihydroorotate dehydrogenase [Spirochaetaceae bacterium]
MGDRLATTFLGQRLTTPLVLPAGVVGMSFSSLKRAVDSGAGMVTTKSFTIEPRAGHPGPVIAEFDCGLMNCMGLCNPGIDDGLTEIEEFRRVCTAPVIVSVFGTTESEFAVLARSVRGSDADFIELNLSCPNVAEEFGGAIASSPKAVHAMIAAAKDESSIPVIAKLSPNTDDIAAVARAAVDAGADGISLINTLGPGMVIDIIAEKPVLSNLVGGLSGPSVKPIAVRSIFEVRREVTVPIIGMGGVSTGEDAVELLMAGADVIGIGTAVYYRGPSVFKRVGEEIINFLDRTGRNSVAEIDYLRTSSCA